MTETAVLTKLCDTADVSEDLPVRAEIEGFGYAIFQAGDQYYMAADPCSHGLSVGWLPGRSASSGGLPVERSAHRTCVGDHTMQVHLKFVPYPRIIA